MDRFDALLLVSFGGPEKHEDVLPFLENVLRGKNVPRERMLEVAEHYYHFDGTSPINDHCRELLAALKRELSARNVNLPVYWGNRNWRPMLEDTLRQMGQDGIRHAAALVTSAFGSYSSCRQYREDIMQALERLGMTGLVIEKLPNFHDRPEFIEVMVERVRAAQSELPGAQQLIFTAHSIPMAMAETSPYLEQLQKASARVALSCGAKDWALVFQSRSGPPSQPWLGPDVCEYLRAQHAAGLQQAILCPIGFLSDHMEVLYDLDTEARAVCEALGMKMVRAGTAGSHPKLVSMYCDLFLNAPTTPVGAHCETGCCPAPQRSRPPATLQQAKS